MSENAGNAEHTERTYKFLFKKMTLAQVKYSKTGQERERLKFEASYQALVDASKGLGPGREFALLESIADWISEYDMS